MTAEHGLGLQTKGKELFAAGLYTDELEAFLTH